VAEALAKTVPLEVLHPRAIAAGAACNGPWAVAFSGGADSLALLLLLWAHFPERRRSLIALHFDHRLRGRASAGDAAFCAKVCAGLGVRFVAEAWTDRPAKVSEAGAREARHAFFRGTMRRRRAQALWLGHQLDDIAETFFMRVGRGSGAGGLAAPRPVQGMEAGGCHLRPLLTVSKADLQSALRAAGAIWREDRSNAGDAFLRNRLRATVLPAWREAHRDREAFAGAALSRERLEEDDDALETWRRELAPVAADGRLDLRPLAGRPRALWRRALQVWLLAQPAAHDLSRQGFETLLAAAESGRATRFSLGRKGFAVIRRGWLAYEPSRQACAAP
jgi:tRNA(Ile)-lysidine synthase